MIRTLADLIRPMTEEEFIVRLVQKEITYIFGAREQIESLVSLAEINEILESETLTPPRVRISRDDTPIPESLYTDLESGQLCPAAVHNILRKGGASLVVDDIGPLIPRLSRLERAIERRLREKTSINAYLSLAKGGAFEAHYDNHDVLIVQVQGKKHWQLFETCEPFSTSIKPFRRGTRGPSDVTWEKDLEPGEMLFIPRGVWHKASVNGGFSIHLTFTVVSRNGFDFANWLMEQLASDDLLGQDLPHLAGDQELDHHEARLKSRISEILSRADFQSFLGDTDGLRHAAKSFNLGVAWVPAETDVLVSMLRRPLKSRVMDVSQPVAHRVGGQSHLLSPAMYETLCEIDSQNEGIDYGVLIKKVTDRWTPSLLIWQSASWSNTA